MNDYFYGAASGLCQTIVGYPMDTCKVMMQNNKGLHDFNFRSVLNGMKFPLCSSMMICSVNFGSYNYMRETLQLQVPIAGAISGYIISPMVFISDFGKVNYQMNRIPVWSQLFQRHGFFCSSMRETIAYTVYFTTCYELRDNNIGPFLAGGVAGLANWTVTYPIDVVRTRQIANNCSITEAIQLGSLWRGYIPCASRAIIVNAIGFYVYDGLKTHFSKLTTKM